MKPRAKIPHPLQWIFEPLESEPSFFQKHMFGCQAAYLFGRLVLVLAAGEEPWNGLLVCTSREFHSQLLGEHPSLQPHTVLPKWLYVSQTSDGFEETAQRLVHQALKNDPRIGIEPKSAKRKSTKKKAKAKNRGTFASNDGLTWARPFSTLEPMISYAQKTKQACLCCTCCMSASSGAGSQIL